MLPEGDSPGPHRIEQVTVPVFGSDGSVELVIGLTGFVHDLTLDDMRTYVAPLIAAAYRITARLGAA